MMGDIGNNRTRLSGHGLLLFALNLLSVSCQAKFLNPPPDFTWADFPKHSYFEILFMKASRVRSQHSTNWSFWFIWFFLLLRSFGLLEALRSVRPFGSLKIRLIDLFVNLGVRSLKLAFCGSWGWRRGAILLSCFLVKLAVWFFASVILLFRTVWVVSPSRISSLRSSGLGYASSPKHSHLLPCLQIFTLIHSSWKSTDVSKEANLSFLFSSRKANLACSRFFTASA